jgi:hypothetical protein
VLKLRWTRHRYWVINDRGGHARGY